MGAMGDSPSSRGRGKNGLLIAFLLQPWTLQCPAQRVRASPQIPRTAAKCGVPEKVWPR